MTPVQKENSQSENQQNITGWIQNFGGNCKSKWKSVVLKWRPEFFISYVNSRRLIVSKVLRRAYTHVVICSYMKKLKQLSYKHCLRFWNLTLSRLHVYGHESGKWTFQMNIEFWPFRADVGSFKGLKSCQVLKNVKRNRNSANTRNFIVNLIIGRCDSAMTDSHFNNMPR